MIRRRHKKSIARLLILGMLHLVLISVPGGMLMAGPMDCVSMEQAQLSNPDAPACDREAKLIKDQGGIACDQCSDDLCAAGCSYCTLAYLGDAVGLPGPLSESENFITSPPLGLPLLGSPPIPRPPTHFHS